MSESSKINKLIPVIFILLLAGAGIFFASRTLSTHKGGDTGPADFSKGVSKNYKVYQTNLSLTSPTHLEALGRDSLPWGGQIQADDENSGHIATFVAKGKRAALKDPYIQVYYVNRKNPGFSTKDSALMAIEKTIFLVQESKMLNKRRTIKTQNGREALTGEYLWGKRPVFESFIKEKYVAYGYIDHNEKYLLAFTLTTGQKEEFENYLPDFYYILKSYK